MVFISLTFGLLFGGRVTLLFAFAGCFLKNFALIYPPDFKIIDITKEKYDHFLSIFSNSLERIREILSDSQEYNLDYVYSLNQLKIFPLIKITLDGKNAHIAPIPTYLFWRLTEGIIYELFKEPKFGNLYGQSFQNYVGEVLKKTKSDSQVIHQEKEYHVKKNRKDTVDWILEEGNYLLFIECKTKKLKQDSKELLEDAHSLDDDLDKMADSIIQTYKQILDFNNGYYPIKFPLPTNKIFPIILTMTEWYAFGEKIIKDILDEKILKKIPDQPEDMHSYPQKYPYTICSIIQFERALQIMAEVGIYEFMSNKIEGEHRLWEMDSYASKFYSELFKNCNYLFPEEFESIFPEEVRSRLHRERIKNRDF